jgi:hypothetical protein
MEARFAQVFDVAEHDPVGRQHDIVPFECRRVFGPVAFGVDQDLERGRKRCASRSQLNISDFGATMMSGAFA